MKCLIQRVIEASVSIDNTRVASIDQGILLLLGIERHDDDNTVPKAAEKLLNYRLFSDSNGKMNLSLKDIHQLSASDTTAGKGELLVVSQFTLSANTQKGLRPSFSQAAAPTQAQLLYQQFIDYCQIRIPTQSGVFGADMQVQLINDGPVTFMLEF